MNKQLIASVSCVMCFTWIVNADTTINFDYYPDGSPIPGPTSPPYTSLTNEFVEYGIIFDSTTNVMEHGAHGDLNTPPNYIYADHGSQLGEDSVTLDARFVLPTNPSVDATVTWVEFFQDRGALSGGGVFIAYDVNGNKVIEAPFNGSGETFHWEYAGGIHRIYVGLCYDGIDDLAFSEVTPVPEPAMLSLLAVGGLAMLRRKAAR